MNTAAYNSIKVVARFRPRDAIEIRNGGSNVVEFQGEDTVSIDSRDINGSFTFDRVFDVESQQKDVFDFSIKPTVDDILNGYNGTVFAYGQTGSGKTYTMMGPDIDDFQLRGIIPRIVEQIFASILASPGNIEYTVKVSYMEIYMERIRDLLNPHNDNLPIHEDKSRGVYVKGLLEIYVASVQEVYDVMRRGGAARAVAATTMNQESSRSHSIFVVNITQKNMETGSAKSGQLFLVDLAGSEKVGKTGASGQTLEEAKKINKSLSALGNVINSLTDGKSTHIPYRDSKLTRILQESLGGNSRTTLIICCSPSQYNDSETTSTLRFGVRAKSIKNKAKINAELSPSELKALLRKAQSQILTYEQYISLLEGEIKQWRNGRTVSQDHWVSMEDMGSTSGLGQEPRLESSRSATPFLERDEKEEFLRRENELQDQIAEKETQLTVQERALDESHEEASKLKTAHGALAKENERLALELDDFKMQLEKVNYESKEAIITMDSLKESNHALSSELDEVKRTLLDLKAPSSDANGDNREFKQKKKADKMAQMMAEFEIDNDGFQMSERLIREAISKLENATEGETLDAASLDLVKKQLLQAQEFIHETEQASWTSSGAPVVPSRREARLEQRLLQMEQAYEALLEENLDDSDIEHIKTRLQEAISEKQRFQMEDATELKQMVTRKAEESAALNQFIRQLEQSLQQTGGSTAIDQQLADFDAMKNSLMRDLQNRCERVVELELSLDETREQYNSILKSSDTKAQQKKMVFLEKNLEQLTHVQRQLVEQNTSLKREIAIAERKLNARNERIQSLEVLLSDSQDKLTVANHRFEAQLDAVKERLEAAKVSRGVMGGSVTASPNAMGGSRIVKPLRGGAEVRQTPESPRPESRSRGWFFDRK